MRRSVLTLALASCLALGCAHSSSSTTASTPAATTPAATGDTTGAAQAGALPVATQELTFKAGDKTLKAFLAYPDGAKEKLPGVLVVHEWWGLNDYARSRARQLAAVGYVALAADLYGDGRSSDHPADAKALMSELMKSPDEARRRFDANLAALKGDPRVDATRVAAIGYCLGGAAVLQAARRGEDLDAVASFHGNYATQAPMAKGAFPGIVFVAHGAADSFAPPEQLAALRRELEAAGARHEIVEYPGAKHGFTNPHATEAGKKGGMDIAYDAGADAQSWQKLLEILQKAFAQP